MTDLAIVVLLLVVGPSREPGTSPSEQARKTAKEVPRLFLTEGWKDGWFRATGSWVEGKKDIPTHPFFSEQEAVDFNCYKDIGICLEATAQLTTLGQLMARTQLYEIQTWAPEQIQTKPIPEPCGSFQITIDRVAKKVFATKTNTAQKSSICPEPGTVELIELKTTTGATGRDNKALARDR